MKQWFVTMSSLAVAPGLMATATEIPGRHELFTPKEIASYQPKGPADCFRQICFEYNSASRPEVAQGRYFQPEVLRNYFSKADPVAYAEFCRKLNLDGVLLLAVPEGGFTTYLQTKVGEPFPFLAEHGFDFFGRVIQECHRRGISVFGYICIGWGPKGQRDFPEDFPKHGSSGIPTLNGRYGDRIIEYAREILRHYPVDGIRTDILDQNTKARTAGDRAFYKERYGEVLPEVIPSWQREQDFRLASISRFVHRFHEACRQVKPSVPVWHNWFSLQNAADLRDAPLVDIAYEEFADPFSTLFLRGVFGARGMISGKLLQNPQRRLCLVLGGRAYDYFPVDRPTALPDQALIDSFKAGHGYYGNTSGKWLPPSMHWFDDDLAPFYASVKQYEPYLRGAEAVSSIAIVYSEASRFRFANWSRGEVIKPLKAICRYYLDQNEALTFMSSFDVTRRDLARFRVVAVPGMSGLKAGELDALRRYAANGGKVVWIGEAALYDEAGRRLPNFANAADLGLDFQDTAAGPLSVSALQAWDGPPLPVTVTNALLVRTKARAGKTLVLARDAAGEWPLIQALPMGQGMTVYLATGSSAPLATAVMDWLRGPPPVATSVPGKHAYLTWQKVSRRWVLHLIDDGNYDVTIRRDYAAISSVGKQLPPDGWSAQLFQADAGVRIAVRGNAVDRLLLLN